MYPGDRPQSVYNMVLSSLGFLYSGLLFFWPSSPDGSTEVGSVVLVLSCSWGHILQNAPLLLKKHLGLVAVLRGCLPAPLAPWAVIATIFLL